MLRLRQEMTQSLFGQLKQGLQGIGAQGTDGLRQMLGDLNRLLRQQAAGGRPDVQGFMDRWGQMFPGVQSLDQLLDQMARQSAQMQSLLESLTPEQRRELEALQQAMLDEPGMQEALDELGEHLDRLGLAPASAAVPGPGRDAALAPGGPPADAGAPRSRSAGGGSPGRRADRARRPRRSRRGARGARRAGGPGGGGAPAARRDARGGGLSRAAGTRVDAHAARHSQDRSARARRGAGSAPPRPLGPSSCRRPRRRRRSDRREQGVRVRRSVPARPARDAAATPSGGKARGCRCAWKPATSPSAGRSSPRGARPRSSST